MVDGIGTERKISIPKAQAYHLIQHIVQQMHAIEDDNVKNDVHNARHCNSEK